MCCVECGRANECTRLLNFNAVCFTTQAVTPRTVGGYTCGISIWSSYDRSIITCRGWAITVLLIPSTAPLQASSVGLVDAVGKDKQSQSDFQVIAHITEQNRNFLPHCSSHHRATAGSVLNPYRSRRSQVIISPEQQQRASFHTCSHPVP